MTIGLDVDGVLADFVLAFNRLAKDETGVDLPYPAPSWNWMADRLPPAECQRLLDRTTKIGWWSQVPPLPGCHARLDLATQWAVLGHQVYFITARPGRWAKWETENWLFIHGMTNPTVLISEAKGALATALGLDIMIEDRLEYAAEVATTGTRVLLVDHPYNQSALLPPGVERPTDEPFLIVDSLCQSSFVTGRP